MKYIYLIITLLFVLSSNVFAAHLVCDAPPPAEQITEYEVFMDGVSLGKTPAPLYYDLGNITPGEYEFTATAINVWGASNPSNPYVSPPGPSAPAGTRMEK